VRQQGWTGLRNGDLLRRAAAAAFDAFVTADQSLQFQQNLAGSPLRIIILVAQSTRLQDIVPLVPGLMDAIRNAAPAKFATSAQQHSWHLRSRLSLKLGGDPRCALR
jgi:hypothetical protein